MSTPDPQTVREIARKHIRSGWGGDIGTTIVKHLGNGVLGDEEYVDWYHAVVQAWRVELRALSWPDEQRPADPVSGGQQDGAEEACVCGDPNCMPYWRPVHRQMNELRLRSDRAAADFTKAMIEEICEERTRAEQAEAERDALATRVAELEAGRAKRADPICGVYYPEAEAFTAREALAEAAAQAENKTDGSGT